MLDLIVVHNSASVDIAKAFLRNDVATDSLEEDELGPIGKLLGRGPLKVLDGLQPALFRLWFRRDDTDHRSVARNRESVTTVL
jgi:hypothetical protein